MRGVRSINKLGLCAPCLRRTDILNKTGINTISLGTKIVFVGVHKSEHVCVWMCMSVRTVVF